MRIEIKMPDMATTESEITVLRWLVEVGQPVKRGVPFLEIQTDKATMEVESAVNGVLESVQAKAGDSVAVGQVIAVVEQ